MALLRQQNGKNAFSLHAISILLSTTTCFEVAMHGTSQAPALLCISCGGSFPMLGTAAAMQEAAYTIFVYPIPVWLKIKLFSLWPIHIFCYSAPAMVSIKQQVKICYEETGKEWLVPSQFIQPAENCEWTQWLQLRASNPGLAALLFPSTLVPNMACNHDQWCMG